MTEHEPIPDNVLGLDTFEDDQDLPEDELVEDDLGSISEGELVEAVGAAEVIKAAITSENVSKHAWSRPEIELTIQEIDITEAAAIAELEEDEEIQLSDFNLIRQYFIEISQIRFLSFQEQLQCAKDMEAMNVVLQIERGVRFPNPTNLVKELKDQLDSGTLRLFEPILKDIRQESNLTTTTGQLEDPEQAPHLIARGNRWQRFLGLLDTDQKTLLHLITHSYLARRFNRRKGNEKREIFSQIKQRGEIAREELIGGYLRMAVTVAKKYIGLGVPFEDLIQEANEGIIMASEKFNWRYFKRFSTYAWWWMDRQVDRRVKQDKFLPTHVLETLQYIKHLEDKLAQLHKTPSKPSATADIIANLNTTIDPADTPQERSLKLQVIRIRKKANIRTRDEWHEIVSQRNTEQETVPAKTEDVFAAQHKKLLLFIYWSKTKVVKSFESKESAHSDRTLEDTLESEEDSPPEAAINELLRQDLLNVFHLLTDREREVLEIRYGLLDGKARTLDETGAYFKVHKERIRQMEAKALRKIRTNRRVSRSLREYLAY